MVIDLLTVSFALLGLILFYRKKTLPVRTPQSGRTVSVVIPARNEEANLPVLLAALCEQREAVAEIIVVDDGSTDGTAAVARSFGATVTQTNGCPPGWKGKNLACFTGAQKASGDLLLFLDADIIPRPDMIKTLTGAYRPGSVLSVQPYHLTRKVYEQLSLFFNAIAIAATGLCLPGKDKTVGLFGPVLLMERSLYFDFGGHELVKGEIIEDYQLGALLRKKGIPCDLFLGTGCVSFQMYKGGPADLLWGWSKNFAAGAVKTPLYRLLPVVLWVSAYYAAVICALQYGVSYAAGQGNPQTALVFLAAYLFAGLLLYAKVRIIGSFSLASCLLYALPLAGFTVIFTFSLLLKYVFRRVRWKGRWHTV